MKIAVLTRKDEPFSFRNYRENVLQHLDGDVTVFPFGLSDALPGGCDVLWDPGLGMAKIPKVMMRAAAESEGAKIVGTVHGLRAFSLQASEIAVGSRERVQLAIAKYRRLREWRRFGSGVAKIIGVSEFGANEVIRAFGLPQQKVTSIHHGVDHEVYRAEGERERSGRPYFLHVSSYQRKKNVERILVAYQSLPAEGRPDLVLILPGAPKSLGENPGVTLIDTGLTPKELAPWYRGALAFLFPSLHETFGMPILEAMACGCPVLTSNTTACPEVAGRAAYFVDPRDDAALREGMQGLISDESLRARLAGEGVDHAAEFRWQTCADRHLELFHQVCSYQVNSQREESKVRRSVDELRR